MEEISKIIKSRIQNVGRRFHSNDNISEFMHDGDLEKLQQEVELKFQSVLDSLVIDTDNDHNTQDTAKRVAKMYVNEIFGGRFKKQPKITAFPNMGYKSLYTSGPISIRSTCAHHFQNIVGKAWIGIVPEDEVIGLSKFNRLVHHIAEELQKYAKTPHVAVVVKAEHHCMTHRGVREHESDMTTAVMLGGFGEDPALKQEFYDICLSMKGHK